MKTHHSNRPQNSLNTDSNLLEKTEFPKTMPATQQSKTLLAEIEELFISQNPKTAELLIIFDFIAKKLIRAIFEEKHSLTDFSKIVLKIYQSTSSLRSFLKRLHPKNLEKNSFSIQIDNSTTLSLRKTYAKGNNFVWYLGSKYIGRDDEKTRKDLEEKYRIKLTDLAPDLPSPSSIKEAKKVLASKVIG